MWVSIITVKLWFTNMYFVGFYSVPNLIVIIFNLLYPIFIVGFDCKGCVLERERECEDSSNWSQKNSREYLATKLPAKWSTCLAHDWNVKSQYRMETTVSREYLASKAFPRDIMFCQFVLSDTHFLYPHYIHPHYPQMLKSASKRKP